MTELKKRELEREEAIKAAEKAEQEGLLGKGQKKKRKKTKLLSFDLGKFVPYSPSNPSPPLTFLSEHWPDSRVDKNTHLLRFQ